VGRGGAVLSRAWAEHFRAWVVLPEQGHLGWEEGGRPKATLCPISPDLEKFKAELHRVMPYLRWPGRWRHRLRATNWSVG